jgi:ATP-dependent RNA helicase SUPV3L1/SUV3
LAAEQAPPEMEGFYTFTWAPKPRFAPRPPREAGRRDGAPKVEGEERPKGDFKGKPRGEGGKPRHDGKPGGKPQGDRPRGERNDKPRGDKRDDRPKQFESRPPRAEKPIDPDNPFAALMALKGKV